MPDGLDTSTRSPTDTLSLSQLETAPPSDPFDGDGQIAVGFWSTRHRVAAEVLVGADPHPEGAELPRLVGNTSFEVVGHVEDERAGVAVSSTTRLTRSRVVAVAVHHVVDVTHGCRPGRTRDAGSTSTGCQPSIL